MYTALIIEPRRHPALQFVLKNFLENLDERWQFIIFHGTDNEEWLRDMINKEFIADKDRIQLNNLNVSNLSWEEYNRHCTTAEFIEQIPTEIFLKFETDSMVCPSEKDLIYNFLKYDYVGAPWLKTPGSTNEFNGKVGNSGLSLRKKSKILEVIENIHIPMELRRMDISVYIMTPSNYIDLVMKKPNYFPWKLYFHLVVSDYIRHGYIKEIK